MGRVLQILSQRPLLTGSGVTLDALARRGEAAGWEQHVVVGVGAGDPTAVADLPADRVRPLVFGRDLPFEVVGMSDVMPYPSRTFRSLTGHECDRYASAWRAHLATALEAVRPDVIHSHHLWWVTALACELAGDVPVIGHCHGTGLRQALLCPAIASRIRPALARLRCALLLHGGQEEAARRQGGTRTRVIAAGYDPDRFHRDSGPPPAAGLIVYAGKLADAKGVPALLGAFASLRQRRPEARLVIAGGGDGEEAERIRERARRCGAELVGRLEQPELADLLRRAQVFVLPSLYEGLPLVVAEAAACGARIVATSLPGITMALAAALGPALIQVPVPALEGPDRLRPGQEEPFSAALTVALDRALELGRLERGEPAGLERLTWDGVYAEVEAEWSACSSS